MMCVNFWCHSIVRSFAETYIILRLLIGMSSTMSRKIRYCETVGRILKIRHNKRTSTQMMNTTNQGRVMKVNHGSNKRTSTQMMNTTNQGRVMKPRHGLGVQAEFPVKMDVPKDQKCLGSNKIREVDISDNDTLCMYTSKS
jgi:hypothetical protein